MPEPKRHTEEFGLAKRSPLQVALSSAAYYEAMRSGTHSHVKFVRSILDLPSVKRSKAHRADALLYLLGVCSSFRLRDQAVEAGWELLSNGLRRPIDGYHAGLDLLTFVGVTHPSLELVLAGRELLNRRGASAIRRCQHGDGTLASVVHELILLTYQELHIRVQPSEQTPKEEIQELARQFSFMLPPCQVILDISGSLLNHLVANDVHSDVIRFIGEAAWARLQVSQRQHGYVDDPRAEEIEAVLDSLPDYEE